jgi:nucleotide-binding universal stress UspA family protein
MYTNILIPTDGSELAGKAVEHGIDLAKRIGAKVTVLTVLPPFHTFTTDTQMIEDTPAQYKARMEKQAAKTLGAVTHAARQLWKRRDNRVCSAPLHRVSAESYVVTVDHMPVVVGLAARVR